MENNEWFEQEPGLSREEAMELILSGVTKTKLEPDEYDALVLLLQKFKLAIDMRDEEIKETRVLLTKMDMLFKKSQSITNTKWSIEYMVSKTLKSKN